MTFDNGVFPEEWLTGIVIPISVIMSDVRLAFRNEGFSGTNNLFT